MASQTPPQDNPGTEFNQARQVDRRRFLTTFALGAGLAPVISLTSSLSARRRQVSACYASKRVMDQTDFQYLGAMRLPPELTAFSRAPLAARKVNGQLRFFMTGENSSNAVTNWGSLDPLFEFADTQSYHPNYDQAPRATVLTQWGNMFQGKRTSWLPTGQQIDLQFLLTTGLCYKNNRLYWTYYDAYNVGGRPDWCIGMTDLGSGPSTMTAYGPWRPNIGVKHSSSWILEMPNGTMGLGATLQSGNVGSSWGPELQGGLPFPTPATPGGFGNPDLVVPQKYVQYGFPALDITSNGAVIPGHTLPSMPRPGNYVWHHPSLSSGGEGVITYVDPLLNGGVGSWTELDYVHGCTYIDLPEKHGVLFAGALATGHVWYGVPTECGHGQINPCSGGTGPNATGFEPRWWIYNPDQCMLVATGNLGANLSPAFQFNPATAIHPIQLGCNRAFGGIYFDRDTRKLYIAAYQADLSIPGLELPLIHVYQVTT
jgi:hypothetical protein